jgi:hypothetical protein
MQKTRYCLLDIYLHKKLLYTFNQSWKKNLKETTEKFTHICALLTQYFIPLEIIFFQ